MSRGFNSDCRVYVGDLRSGVNKQDLEDAFNHYGYLKSVWIARNPPGFAFIEFDDPRDAKDAARNLDGTRICGRHVKVEVSNGRSRRGGGGGGGYSGGGGGRYSRGPSRDRRTENCYACGERGHYARDCSLGVRPGDGPRRSRARSRTRSRSESPRRRRRYSRSKSRSPSGAKGKD